MYEQLDQHFAGKYHDMIEVLKKRYRNFFEMDGSRRKWKAKAEKAEARIEELERSRRRLKLRERALEENIRALKNKTA